MNPLDPETIKAQATEYNKLYEKIDALQSENKRLEEEKVVAKQEGYKEGLTAYAWWKDGVQYVGTCGTTLKEALTKGGG